MKAKPLNRQGAMDAKFFWSEPTASAFTPLEMLHDGFQCAVGSITHDGDL
jgi:hypothetical protein